MSVPTAFPAGCGMIVHEHIVSQISEAEKRLT